MNITLSHLEMKERLYGEQPLINSLNYGTATRKIAEITQFRFNVFVIRTLFYNNI
jgi:hypothetical protein